jgi:hypothetical protein
MAAVQMNLKIDLKTQKLIAENAVNKKLMAPFVIGCIRYAIEKGVLTSGLPFVKQNGKEGTE